MYMPSSRPKSTQLKPQPQRKTTAATRPRNGTMTARRLATRMPSETRSGSSPRGGNSATGSATGTTVDSVISHLVVLRLHQRRKDFFTMRLRELLFQFTLLSKDQPAACDYSPFDRSEIWKRHWPYCRPGYPSPTFRLHLRC